MTEYHEDILKIVFKAGREPTKVTGTCWCPQQRRAHKAPLSAPGTPSPVPEPHVLTEAPPPSARAALGASSLDPVGSEIPV